MAWMAEITWHGHACFTVKGRDVAVLMDPVPSSSGYDLGNPAANIVTVSHDHAGHSALEQIQDGYRLINGPGEYEIQDVLIDGVQTFHDGDRGKRYGKNTVYVVEIEDLVICHLGDIGHVLTDKQVESLGAVDILLVPAGGGPTITPSQASELIAQIDPSIIIPMQFQTERGDLEREPVDGFLKEMASAEHELLPKLRVRKSELGEAVRIVVLEPVSG
jgi:L-ascorbate metabolism protein UlaG (beta-lactamase superfamily)